MKYLLAQALVHQGSIAFGVTENNYLGKVKFSSNLILREDQLKDYFQ